MSFFVIVAWLLVPVAQTRAETLKFRNVHHANTLQTVEVGDVEGHVLGVYERSGLASFDNGETATLVLKGTFDVTKGKGTYQAYTLYTFEDGSAFRQKCQGTITEAGAQCTGEVTSGSGRFAGITGNFSGKGRSLGPRATGADSYFDGTMTYTLPSR